MKLVAQVKLLPADGGTALLATLEAMNTAAQWVADEARWYREWAKGGLQKRCYREVRSRFGLGAQAAIRVIAKAADGYADQTRRGRAQVVDPQGAVAVDDRNLAWHLDAGEVRIWTTTGRQVITSSAAPCSASC